MIPKGFRRFAQLSAMIHEVDQTFFQNFGAMYNSVDPDIRPSIITYINSILVPPVDLDELNRIWDEACGINGVYMTELDGVYNFLTAALPICQQIQAYIDAARPK